MIAESWTYLKDAQQVCDMATGICNDVVWWHAVVFWLLVPVVIGLCAVAFFYSIHKWA